MGKNFEEAVLIVALLKKSFQIPMVVCRAQSLIHKEILELIGVDYVILPEQEAGIKLADKLSLKYSNFNRITEDYSITFIRPKKKWVDKRIEEIDFEEKYDLICLGKKNGEIIKKISNEYKIQDDDILVFAGNNKNLEIIST